MSSLAEIADGNDTWPLFLALSAKVALFLLLEISNLSIHKSSNLSSVSL